jgi:hypothetical protein
VTDGVHNLFHFISEVHTFVYVGRWNDMATGWTSEEILVGFQQEQQMYLFMQTAVLGNEYKQINNRQKHNFMEIIN